MQFVGSGEFDPYTVEMWGAWANPGRHELEGQPPVR